MSFTQIRVISYIRRIPSSVHPFKSEDSALTWKQDKHELVRKTPLVPDPKPAVEVVSSVHTPKPEPNNPNYSKYPQQSRHPRTTKVQPTKTPLSSSNLKTYNTTPSSTCTKAPDCKANSQIPIIRYTNLSTQKAPSKMPPNNHPPRQRPTHFICLPLITPTSLPQLSTTLTQFTNQIQTLKFPSLPGSLMPLSAIKPLTTMHLTIGILHLPTQEEIESAINLLKTIDTRKLWEETRVEETGDGGEGDEMRITLKGLEYMGPNPNSISILYAPPLDPQNRIYNFCLAIQKIFNLNRNPPSPNQAHQETKLLLHVTVVNTVYSLNDKNVRSLGRKRGGGSLRFDGREVLEDWEHRVWMEDVRVEKVAICRMGARRNEEGEMVYEEVGRVDMP